MRGMKDFGIAPLGATETGRVGELLAAYTLEKHGLGCSLVDRRGSDIWCMALDGTLFKLEVKTATAPSHEGRGTYSYSYQVHRRDADWFAFVALDREAVIFRPRLWLKPYTTHRLHPDSFGSTLQRVTLNDLMHRTQKKTAEAA